MPASIATTWQRMTKVMLSTSRWRRASLIYLVYRPRLPHSAPLIWVGQPVSNDRTSLWGGRFSGGPADALAGLSRSPLFVWRLARHDIAGFLALASFLNLAVCLFVVHLRDIPARLVLCEVMFVS